MDTVPLKRSVVNWLRGTERDIERGATAATFAAIHIPKYKSPSWKTQGHVNDPRSPRPPRQ